MDKILKYKDYKTALKEKKINELFQESSSFDSKNLKLIIEYPKNLSSNDGFFFFMTNYAQKYFKEQLILRFNLNIKDIEDKVFSTTNDLILYKNKPFIAIKESFEGKTGNIIKKEYKILN